MRKWKEGIKGGRKEDGVKTTNVGNVLREKEEEEPGVFTTKGEGGRK